MPCCGLHIFQAGSIIQRSRNEGRSHRMCRVSPTESNMARILAQRTVNHVGVQMSARIEPLTIVTHRSEERTLDITSMSSKIEIIADALRGLRVNRQTPLLATFADHLQGFVSAIHMEVSDFQAGDFRAAKSNLQTNRENRSVTHAEH